MKKEKNAPLSSFRSYPLLLVIRFLCSIMCIFLATMIDLDLSAKALGSLSAIPVIPLAIFKYSRGFKNTFREKGKKDVEERMFLATASMVIVVIGLWYLPDIGLIGNVIRIIVLFLAFGLILGVTIGEQIFLHNLKVYE